MQGSVPVGGHMGQKNLLWMRICSDEEILALKSILM